LKMPNHLIHCKLSSEFFGKSYYRLHMAIDSGYPFKRGKHRNFFPHDSFSAMIIAKDFYPHDEKAVLAAQFHLELDQLCSSNPALHDYLKQWAKLKVKRRRKRKKREKKETVPPEFRRLEKDIKKLMQISMWAKQL
jgi:hypothetical protein